MKRSCEGAPGHGRHVAVPEKAWRVHLVLLARLALLRRGRERPAAAAR